MLLVAARSLHQDPLMVSAFRLQRLAIFRSRNALMPLMPGIKRSDGTVTSLFAVGRSTLEQGWG